MSEIPPNSFIKTEAGYFYVYSKTKRLHIISTRILESWAPSYIIETTEDNPLVAAMRTSTKMRFRNGSLLYSHADGKMYLIADARRRHVKNPDWLDILGTTRDKVVWVSEEEITLHEEGEPLV